jgi:hypothetical protein
MRKEGIAKQLKALYQHFPRWNEVNQKRLQCRKPATDQNSNMKYPGYFGMNEAI